MKDEQLHIEMQKLTHLKFSLIKVNFSLEM